jgi:hypothetical protein
MKPSMRFPNAMLALLALLAWGCRVQLPEAESGQGWAPVHVHVAGAGVARAVVKHDKAAAARWLSYIKKAVDPDKLSGLVLKGALETAALPDSRLRLTVSPEKGGGATLRLFTSSFGLRISKNARPCIFLNVLFQLRGPEGKTLQERKISCNSRGRIVPAGLLPPQARWSPSDDEMPAFSQDIPSALHTLGRWCGAEITKMLIHDLHL